MNTIDQCPSSIKEGTPLHTARASGSAVGVGTGQRYWRGLDDLADTGDFRDFLEKEFPASAAELLDGSRRTFLKLMGAGLALAGAATVPGCRRPDHKIMPYSRSVPEEVVPGKALFYATSIPLPGMGAEGLLVETHENRPTKTEGNPLHPANQGKSSVWSQSCVLDLYDPDRCKFPEFVRKGEAVEATWDDFAAWSKQHFASFDADKGAGLAIIYDKCSGPTREAQIARLKAKWPRATFAAWNALENHAAVLGTTMCFGEPMREVLDLAGAKTIVSFERDFLQLEPGALANARGWAASRRVNTTKDGMSRVYAVESCYSLVGAAADHRLCLAPGQIPAAIVALATRLLKGVGIDNAKSGLAEALLPPRAEIAGIDAKFMDALATELVAPANRGKSVIVCGQSLPPVMHALVAAMNMMLGNVGVGVKFAPAAGDEATSPVEQLALVAKRLDAGEINTVLALNTNPVFNAPADMDFGKKFSKAEHRVALCECPDETSALCTWRLPASHVLERWGDTRALDGTISPTQPMIAPLYDGKSDIEVLAIVAGEARTAGYEIVRAAWKENQAKWFPRGGADFERLWRRALHDGLAAGTATVALPKRADWENVGTALAGFAAGRAASESSLDVVFAATNHHDGRYANNSWICELPDPVSRVVWDNPAYLSPHTAEKLGLLQTAATDKKPKAMMADLKVGLRSMRIAVWAVPGVAENTVVLPLGWGREAVGLVGQGCGFNTFAVRSSDGMWAASGATLTRAADGEKYPISCTQTHGSMEGRALVREVDLPAWHKHGDEPTQVSKDAYGREKSLVFAERLEGGELSHMPALVGMYANPLNGSAADADPKALAADPSHAGKPARAPAFTEKPQWGMSIDLATCTGCNVCTVACQSENNIPVVGKIEVNKGRELQWIRVDRYFKGDDEHSTSGVMYQPVACVHCENAPCETVCPVNATVHGSEGHNFMTYNRCIGTRYCANNCPYKVRRFNFFDYGVAKYNGAYFGQEALEGILPEALESQPRAASKINPNLIPPRLRKRLDEISKMQKNPNVTVRSRGVMEKCSYCIQRTNEAKIQLKLKGKPDGSMWRPDDGVPDGFVQTACQQACPTDAIVFGDILDKASRVSQAREHQRSYLLLGYLNTRPRTTYMVGMKNPNPGLRAPVEDPFGDHGGDHTGDGGGHGALPAGDPHKVGYVNPSKAGREGYLMSLAVLGDHA
ncbi:MAG: TAT-variant-translocated molybdopterin oxidoreductase [Phycisphaerales bacterium]